MKNQPAGADGGSSTKVVLPEHEKPAGRRRRYQSMKNQPAAGDGRSSTEVVLPGKEKTSRPPETAVAVLKLYYRGMKNQPAAGDGRSSIKVLVPEIEKPAGRRRRPFQY